MVLNRRTFRHSAVCAASERCTPELFAVSFLNITKTSKFTDHLVFLLFVLSKLAYAIRTPINVLGVE